jgi:hypothetical protein
MPIKLTGLALVCLLAALPARADLPEGYFVWSKGDEGNFASRKIYRMTLPGKTGVMALTSGEDVECQISPDGKWVAYAKAKLPNTDYHQFDRWKLYLVSIDGGDEIEIDADGYWPSWGGAGVLYYSKADGEHTHITRVEIDDQGNAGNRTTLLSTETAFPSIPEINECFVAPDGSWFAGRTRQIADSGVGAYRVDPPEFNRLAWSGGSGCMPYVAPDGQWGYIAGSSNGVRWGDAPHVPNRLENQQLVAARPNGGACYHPGVSTDGQWFMTGHSQDADQNAGAWDIYIYKLDQKTVSEEQLLVGGGFNGWPSLWVGVVEQTDGGDEDGEQQPDADADAGADTGTDTGAGTDTTGDDGSIVKGSCACSGGSSASVCMGLLVLIVWRRRGHNL